MANSSIIRTILTNPNKITSKTLLKPSQFLLTRPISSTPLSEHPTHPTNPTQIVEELFKTRTEGLFVSASKVFEKMSKRLRPFSNNRKMTHEAMDRSRGHGKLPEEIAHIAVVEAYANAGLTSNKANKIYLQMVSGGTIPNIHTYNNLVKLLAIMSSSDANMIPHAQKYFTEMFDKGLKPDASTSVAVFKALVKEGKIVEGKEFLKDVKKRGFVIDDRVFREVVKGVGGPIKVLKGKGGPVVKGVLEILFDKKI